MTQLENVNPDSQKSPARAGTPNKNTARVRAAMAGATEQFIPLLKDYMVHLSTHKPGEFGFSTTHRAMMQVLTFLCDRSGVNVSAGDTSGEEEYAEII